MRAWIARRITERVLTHLACKHRIFMFTDGESLRAVWAFHRKVHAGTVSVTDIHLGVKKR